jgi:preprotein translocase subunit SecE
MAEEKKVKGIKGFAGRVSRFFRDMRGETKKIVWPSKKQIMNNTAVVLVVVVISSLFVGALDFIFTWVVDAILKIAA